MKLESTNIKISTNEDMRIVKITTKKEKIMLTQQTAEELRDLLNDYLSFVYTT